MIWYSYIVACYDGSYYTGVTTNVLRRVREHNNSKKGAQYTRGRRPVRLVLHEEHPDRSTALRVEAHIKGLKVREKDAYIAQCKERDERETNE